jgi:ABC-2 type transport system permease protein
MAVIIGLSFGLVPLASLSGGQTFFTSGSTVVLGYQTISDYRLLAYSFNAYGQPVQGTLVNLTLTDHSGVHVGSTTTNSSGFSSWTVPGNPGAGQVTYSMVVKGTATGIQSSGGGLLPSVAKGEVFELNGAPIALVTDPSNSSKEEVLLVYEGANGSLPSSYAVYFSYGSGTTFFNQLNESQMTLLGTPKGFVTTFKLPEPPSGATQLSLGLFEANGTSVFSSSYSGQIIGPGQVTVTPDQIFTSFTAAILSLVVPLMAILVAYGSYGKDKATGVLESVLTRPVTRRGLAFSRYVSILLSISVALVISMGVMEAISQALLGSVLPPAFAAYTVGSLVVEAAAFVGITMLISYLLKSTGGIIGLGVGLWIVLDFFWGTLILVASLALGIQIGSGDYLGLTIRSAFFNPAQFYVLVGDFMNGLSISSSFGAQTPISPATYGLTPFSIIAAGILWVLVPAGLVLFSASRRD